MCLPQGTHFKGPETVKALTRDRQDCNWKPGTSSSQRPVRQPSHPSYWDAERLLKRAGTRTPSAPRALRFHSCVAGGIAAAQALARHFSRGGRVPRDPSAAGGPCEVSPSKAATQGERAPRPRLPRRELSGQGHPAGRESVMPGGSRHPSTSRGESTNPSS